MKHRSIQYSLVHHHLYFNDDLSNKHIIEFTRPTLSTKNIINCQTIIIFLLKTEFMAELYCSAFDCADVHLNPREVKLPLQKSKQH